KSHLARVATATALPTDFPGGWERRMAEEQQLRHQYLEAAGVYGPIREEVFAVTRVPTKALEGDESSKS
ncbi:MAG: hypothetical protein ACQKBU_02730, partial [Verrucomicrobiales bacterium]